MHNVRVYQNLERVVKSDPQVTEALSARARELAVLAEQKLVRHRKTGDHKITHTKGKVDNFVNLEGPAALSLEEGHHDARSGEWVEGLHIMRNLGAL